MIGFYEEFIRAFLKALGQIGAIGVIILMIIAIFWLLLGRKNK